MFFEQPLRPDEKPPDDAIQIAELCFAVLGKDKPYMWSNYDSAKYIAQVIGPGAVAEPWIDD